jgi:hypothetical protein
LGSTSDLQSDIERESVFQLSSIYATIFVLFVFGAAFWGFD